MDRKQTERFIEIVKSMGMERQGGLLLMLEGLKIAAGKEKSGS